MAFDTFTTALNVSTFPFVSALQPRSVILPGLDMPQKVPRSLIESVENVNSEIAQHFYMQNIMPTSEGLMSVGYGQLVAAMAPAVIDFDQIIVLRDADENNFLLTPAKGNNYLYAANAGAWVSVNPFTGWPGGSVTRAYVNGRTFVCFQNKGIYEYTTATGVFAQVTLTGITPALIDGIFGSNNYLIAYSGIQLNWSSLIDPTDFTPSINTGAGTAIPQDLKGPVIAGGSISGGFILYTNRNAVVALYTNNARAPFVFKEVSNAGGVTSPEQVTLDASLGYHYAWSSAGLQKVSANGAEGVNATVDDFLSGRIYESFDLTTNTITTEKLTASLKVKISYISGRYLVVSYGKVSDASYPQKYTHAIILDTGLKRWGKIRLDHVDCFSYPYPNIINLVTEVPQEQACAFLQADGTVQLLIMDYRDMQDQGVLLLGKFQLARQLHITMQYLELENVSAAYPPTVYLCRSLDGKNLETPQPLSVLSTRDVYTRYGAPVPDAVGNAAPRTGVNLSFLIKGTFELATSLLTTTRSGKR